jgi:CheY-like chemotaxis protein
VSLPHLLLVDDSEAVLAFERAALAGHYALTTATNGRDALEKIAALKPAAVLLDLSMPQMDGDEVLARLRQDGLRDVPVIIISSERARAEECVRAGARAFLPKPIRAKELLPLIAQVLDEVRREQRRGNLAALFVGVGDAEIGLRLDVIESVVHQVATLPAAHSHPALVGLVEVQGQQRCVIDLAIRLGRQHAAPLEERKLVLIADGGARFALCVDSVRDPVEIPAAELAPAQPGQPSLGDLPGDALITTWPSPRGPVPIVRASALLAGVPVAPGPRA